MLTHIIALLLALLVIAFIYIFTGEVFVLGMAILFLVFFVVEIICNFILVKQLELEIEMKNSSLTSKYILVTMKINNRSFIPVMRGVAKFRIRNSSFDISETFTKKFTAKHGEREIVYELKSGYCGKYEVTVDYVRIYDFLCLTFFSRIKNLKKAVYLYPVCGYIDSVSEIQRVSFEKERYFSHRKNTVLSEILQYREYQPGDNLRHINWKLSDRYGELLVREFDTPTDNQILLTYDVSNENKQTKNTVYAAMMSIAATYIRNNLFHQIGWYKDKDGRIVLRNMYSIDNLYETMRLIFDENISDSPMEILYFMRSGMLNKYAKVIYVTNHMNDMLRKELSLYSNIQVIYIDEEHFGEDTAQEAVKKLAV